MLNPPALAATYGRAEAGRLKVGPPEAISDPILSDLYSYWSSLRRDGELPLRADLDPIDIPQLLPFIALVESADGGRGIRFRLVGTDMAFGSDPTGRYLHEEAPGGPYGEHIAELYRLGATSAEGIYSEFAYGYTADSGPKLIKRLFLPMIGPAETPEMILVGQQRDKSSRLQVSAWQAAPGVIKERKLFAIRSELAPPAPGEAGG